ncbi:phosphate ABC transporter permease subunit PstC [Flexivirga oryzae]|uniref:Phosphate transport system permease protein n=1 Tax=Flexivirga oryzae TaxID=1794944 RepID=A0A839NDP7_9MICO|nr:phosphate ABC transporter permease subunit PstC [Flexivirga oryzae]MBB2892811.1 phosphate transport system permease protein [Flexivirga oryzae]
MTPVEASTRRRWGDLIFGGSAAAAGWTVIVSVVLIAIFLLAQALPAIGQDHANFLTSTAWAPNDKPARFGILQMLWTTVVSSVIAVLIAVPFSVAIALFLTHYSPRWLSGTAATLIDLLAAVPSIIFGVWGFMVLAPKLVPVQNGISDVFGWIPLFARDDAVSGGTTIFTIGIVLAIMILPIITALTREVFSQAPRSHQEAALALGATKWEMIRTAVLPFGRPGIISATMLGLGRALGETIAVMFILSSLPDGAPWSSSIFGGGTTFAAKIASDVAEFTPGVGTGAYIAAGLVLFVLTFVVNAGARIVIERRKAFSE